jgi:hypothetical protein
MNHRHPTDAERQQIRKLVDDIGPVEALRLLAQIVAHDHPDLETGTLIREDIMKSAKLIQATWKAD